VSAISVLDTESGKEVLSLTPPPGFANNLWEIDGARLTFSPDGHRLLLFGRVIGTSAEVRGRLPFNALRVHTWDATPRPE
jgi:hypothetical protein